jgi:hypothetical protein
MIAEGFAAAALCERQGQSARTSSVDPGRKFTSRSGDGVPFRRGITTHVLLVAGLRNPTVRNRYVAVRELLADYNAVELHEWLLELLGAARISRAS